MALSDWIDRLAVWDGFHPDLETLLVNGVGIAVYTALVFAFYHNISRRDPLHTRDRGGWWGKTVHTAETILTFPVLSFGYFALLSLALFVMAKPERATSDILLLSMACVMGVRFTAHLSESMSNDVAKLLPLGLLAVIVVEPGYLDIDAMLPRLVEAVWMAPVLLQYFVLFILAEAALRSLRKISPGLTSVFHKVEHRRTVSKRAMLRNIESGHGHHFHLRREKFHDHGPRDRSHDFLQLDERSGGKPGSGQGVGPASARERNAPKAALAPRAHAAGRPAPKAGPGGKGGKLGTW